MKKKNVTGLRSIEIKMQRNGKRKKMQMATSEFNDDWTVLTFVHHACECTEHVMQDWTKHL